jgi:hypothetical protein
MINSVTAIVMATAAMCTALVSALLVAFRLGRFEGTVTSFMASTEQYRLHTASEIGKVDDRLDRHIERHGGRARGVDT